MPRGLLALVLLSLLACGSDAPRGEGEPCALDRDCAAGLGCRRNREGRNVCTAQPAAGLECDSCQTDAQCLAPLVCSNFFDSSGAVVDRRCGSGVGATTCRTR